MLLTLTARNRESDAVESFEFEPERPFSFVAGQYLKYTLDHPDPDYRGISRYFTIASAPSEGVVMIATRLSTPGSSFKQALRTMAVGDVIEATGPSGRFVYAEPETPAVFIAGGIGITPFRSMLVDLASRASEPAVTLLYANTTSDIPFRHLLDELVTGHTKLKVIYTVSHPEADWRGLVGRVDEPFLREYVPLEREPNIYIAGPKAMVAATAEALRTIGVAASRIKQDFFPGYDP
jgi:ferredoxin-NADP reductase